MAGGGGTPERGSVRRDREILCILFDATNKAKRGQTSLNCNGEIPALQDGWKRKDGWKSSKPVGEWHGVTTNAEGRVIGLELRHNGLVGNIPKELGKLVTLKKLDLSFNELEGIIHPELGNLGALEEVALGHNRLQGGIPKELGGLQALKRLDLSDNPLGGLIPPELGDLNALEEIILSDNELEGIIPKELGKLRALRRLNLSFNAVLGGVIPPELGDLSALEEVSLTINELEGSIPKELGKLKVLKKLDLSHNALEGVIPPELGGLSILEELTLVSNKLQGGIPKELGKLRALKRLDLSDNPLGGGIPPELGDLNALEDLQLINNGLEGCVPPQLGNLQRLGRLFLKNNQLKGLWDHTQDASLARGDQGVSGGSVPNQLRLLLAVLTRVGREGIQYGLSANPWAEPPEVVVTAGIAAVVAYFDDLYSSPCTVRRNSVKIVLVGQEGAGKTSLCKSMKAGRATPTDGSTESTVYADVERMELNGVSARVYDCAGQVAYTGLLQIFLTPKAVCLVVCNAGAFGKRDGRVDDQLVDDQLGKDIRNLDRLRVFDWMRSISQRVPQSDVILVATKCDLVGGNAADMAGRIYAGCRAWLARYVKAGMEPVRLEKGVCLTSCFATASGKQQGVKPGEQKPGNSWECDWCEDRAEDPALGLLHRVVNMGDGSGLRGAEMVLPKSWEIALTVLEALEDGMDPVEAVVQTSAEPNEGLKSSRPASGKAPFQGITVKDLKSRWDAVVLQLSEKGVTVTNPDHALEGALSIREFEGTIVRDQTFVFLDVIWLTRILKPLLNHKYAERYDGSVLLGEAGDSGTILTDDRHIVSWNRLKEKGILEPDLARILWPGMFEYVLPTLASLNLTFPLEHDPAKGLVVLLRLGTIRPDGVGEDIDNFRSQDPPVLKARWTFFLGVPPGMIEKILTRCCSIGGVQTFWRFGVLVRGAIGGSEGSGSFALVLEYSSDSNRLDAEVYGDIGTMAPWAALAYAISAVRTMAAEYPGLGSRAFLDCPQHGEDILVASTASRPGEKLLHHQGCSRCCRDTQDMGAAAVELLRMVDVRQDRAVLFNEMKTRFVGLQPEYAALRPAEPADLPSEEFKAGWETVTDGMEKTVLWAPRLSAGRAWHAFSAQ